MLTVPKKTNYCLNFHLAIYNYFLKIRIPSSNYNIIENVPLDFVVVTNIQKHRKLREKRMRYNTHNNSEQNKFSKNWHVMIALKSLEIALKGWCWKCVSGEHHIIYYSLHIHMQCSKIKKRCNFNEFVLYLFPQTLKRNRDFLKKIQI